MTTELTKAAQQARTPEHIAGVDHAHELLRRMGYHRDGDWLIHANRRGAEAIHVSTISTIVSAGQLVITQRPAAQEEWPGQSNIASPFNACQHKGYCLQIASLPAAPQAPALDAGVVRDAERLDWLESEADDLRTVTTGEDDYDWVVISHHMAKPHEREVGRAGTARTAIDAAIAASGRKS